MPFWKSTPESRARKRFEDIFRNFEGAKYPLRVSLARAAWADNEIRANLAQFLEDPDSDIRYKACFIAAVISEEAPEVMKPFSTKLVTLLEDNSSNWVGIQSQVMSALLHMAQKEPEILRAAIPKLVNRLTHHDEWKFDPDTPGFNAGYGLASIAQKAPDIIKPFTSQFLDLLEDPRDYVRSSTAFAIGMIGEKEPNLVEPCIARFSDLLSDRSKHVRYSAARGLAYIGHKDAKLVEQTIPKLVHLLTDSDDKVRLAAAAAVRDISETDRKVVISATPALAKLLKDYNPLVRGVAEEALERIGKGS